MKEIEIFFVKELKTYVETHGKKKKSDYILNVNKLIKSKFNTELFVLNRVQAFILNYEILRLVDKVLSIKNQKYNRIIYLNSNLTESKVNNQMQVLSNHYPDIQFKPFSLYESEE